MKKFLFNFCFSVGFILSCFAANGMGYNYNPHTYNFYIDKNGETVFVTPPPPESHSRSIIPDPSCNNRNISQCTSCRRQVGPSSGNIPRNLEAERQRNARCNSEKSFAILNEHAKYHGQYAFECVYCGKVFANFFLASSHWRDAHIISVKKPKFHRNNVLRYSKKSITNNELANLLSQKRKEILVEIMEEKSRRKKRRREFNVNSGRDLLHEHDVNFKPPRKKRKTK